MKGVYLLLVVYLAAFCSPAAQGQRRGSVKFASTLSALDSVEAFPTSRSTFTSTTQSASSPRQASKAAAAAAARLSAQPEEDTPRQQHQPQSDVPSARYRPLNRFSSNLRSTATTTTLTKEERRISDDHLQQYQPKSVAPSRPAKYRKAGARSFNKPPVVDPIDESSRGFERTEPELAIQQRSISNQNGRPINQYSARRPAVRLDHDRVTTTTERSRDEASSSFNPSKPTRRTFTRKPIVATTTPANRRTTKRYQNNKKNNSLKVETSSIQSPASSRYSTSSAPEVSVKPFRVATRHQGQQLKAKGQKNFQKFDDAVEEDNYPEHFKLLLKNKPPQQQQEGKLKASSPTKAFRGSNREAVTEPQIEPEKKVHSVLRKPNKVRQRPVLSQRISSPTTTTTTEVYLPIIEDLATDLPLLDDENDREENSIDPEEDDRQFPSRFRESAEKFSREFVTEDLLYRNEPPKRGFAQPSTIQPPLELAPEKFSAKYRAEDLIYDQVKQNNNNENGVPMPSVLPALYEPTVPPPTTATQQQQSVRYIDENGKYISDQDIAQFVQQLRQQLLQNLITILSSALQTNSVA